MTVTRFRVSTHGLLAAALMSCAARTAFSQSPETLRLKVLVPQSTSAIPFLILAKENPLPGIVIRTETFASHPQALALLLRGEADLLLTGTSQGWENRLDGSPIVMVNTGIWGVSSLIGKDAAIKTFADLKGKKSARPFPGSPLDFQTRAILATERLDVERDVSISYGAFTQSIPRLLAGQLDAVALPEPQATVMVRERGLLRLVRYADEWAKAVGGDGRSPQVSLFASLEFLGTHKLLVADLTDAWGKASAKAQGDPAGAAAQFSAALSTDRVVLEEAIRNTLFGVPSFDENKDMVMDYYKRVLPYFPGVKGDLDAAFFFQP